MNKTMFEFMLEQHFERFEFGDVIQVGEKQIYFEFSRYGGDFKMRIPFDFEKFEKRLSTPFITSAERDLIIVGAISELKTIMLEYLLDLKEEE